MTRDGGDISQKTNKRKEESEKKTTIATIISIALMAILATPVLALEGETGIRLPSGDCDCTSAYTGCYCDDLPESIEYPDCAHFLDAVRNHPAYYGEDEDIIYMKGSIIDYTTYTYELDANGTYLMYYSLDAIEAWMDADCPAYEN